MAPPGANECVLSFYVPDDDAVQARYEAALSAGGTTIHAPSQREWGAFAAQVADPDRHLWMTLVAPSGWTG